MSAAPTTAPARPGVQAVPELGQPAPVFHDLPATDGQRYSLSSFDGREALAVVFSGNGCLTAKSCEDRLIALQEAYGGRGLQLVVINPNNPYLSPPDTLAQMSLRAGQKGFNFPYLKDETGAVGGRTGRPACPPSCCSTGIASFGTGAGSTMPGTPPG